jgi:hypothetical protein
VWAQRLSHASIGTLSQELGLIGLSQLTPTEAQRC